MLIFMLAATMTVAMLIGTVFGLREEAERGKLQARVYTGRGFGATLPN